MISNRSIIIVSESKKDMRKLAHHLFNVFGTLDGFDAAIWEEKHYKDNEPTLPASQPIIFIGETDTSKLLIPTLEWKFNDANMRIGWTGKRAVIYVEKKALSKDAYVRFSNNLKAQAEKIQGQTRKVTSWVQQKHAKAFKAITPPIASSSLDLVKNSKLGEGFKGAKAWLDKKDKGLESVFLQVHLAPIESFGLAKDLILSGQVLKQQYSYVLNTFIADYLFDFLGRGE